MLFEHIMMIGCGQGVFKLSLDENRDKTGTKQGQNRDKTGTKQGQNTINR